MILSTVASARYCDLYPTHIAGNKNYIFVDGHMGTAWYVDRSTLNVIRYAPPNYNITIDVVSVDNANNGNTTIAHRSKFLFGYEFNSHSMYFAPNNQSDWRYLNPRGPWSATGIVMPAGEMAFFLAYNMTFYGSRAAYNREFYEQVE